MYSLLRTIYSQLHSQSTHPVTGNRTNTTVRTSIHRYTGMQTIRQTGILMVRHNRHIRTVRLTAIRIVRQTGSYVWTYKDRCKQLYTFRISIIVKPIHTQNVANIQTYRETEIYSQRKNYLTCKCTSILDKSNFTNDGCMCEPSHICRT